MLIRMDTSRGLSELRMMSGTPQGHAAGFEHKEEDRGKEREIPDDALRNQEACEYQRIRSEMEAAHRDLRESEKRLRALSRELLRAQEDERKRIARELHDSVAQCLAAVKFSTENVLEDMDQQGYNSTVLRNLVPTIQKAIGETRRIYTDLWPAMLDDLGIIATINWLCRELSKTCHDIEMNSRIELEEDEIPESLKIVVFRVIQEAFNNITKFSGAKRVSLSIIKKAESLLLTIEDNGAGFDVGRFSKMDRNTGLGLIFMNERVEISGGSFVMESRIGKGTAIRASWPVSMG
jgi:signal transduction histidine kinase